jgi:hypothetical protein
VATNLEMNADYLVCPASTVHSQALSLCRLTVLSKELQASNFEENSAGTNTVGNRSVASMAS